MKKNVFIVTVLMLCAFSAYPQSVTNYLKQKQRVAVKSATKRVDNEVDKKIDNTVNKGIDKVLNQFMDEAEGKTDSTQKNQPVQTKKDEDYTNGPSEATQQRMGNFMKSMGIGVEIKRKDVYTFNSHMKMKVETTDEDGTKNEPGFYFTYFNQSNNDYAIDFRDEEGQSSTFVYDPDNSCTLILTEDNGQKKGLGMHLTQESLNTTTDETQASDDEVESIEVYKTGRTKTINGFFCKEYKYDNEEGTVYEWITNDLDKKINSRIYKNQVFSGSFWMSGGVRKGTVIQYQTVSKTSKEVNTMTVEEIKFNASHKISTQGYEILGMSVPAATTNQQ